MKPLQSNHTEPAVSSFEFGSFRLEPDGALFRGERRIHLTPKELAALRYLLEHSREVVTSAQLKQALWGDVHVTAGSVPRCVSSLRARLEPEQCIETVYKRGYLVKCTVHAYGGSGAVTLPRLAIVPFACGFQVEPHLGSALSEDIAARLTAAEPAVASVLARDSVFALAANGLSALEIGHRLRADLVLTGTLHAWSSHYRLRVEMIRVKDGIQIWTEDMLVNRHRAEDFERELVDLLSSRMGEQLSPLFPVSSHQNPRASANSRAYEFYLRGHSEWQSLERRRIECATEMLVQAADMNPELIAARVDIVRTSITQSLYGFLAPRAAAEQVRRAAGNIPDLHRNAPTVLPVLGWLSFHLDRNLGGALHFFQHAESLQYESWAIRMRVLLAVSRHRFDEALDILYRAIRVDPTAPWLHARIAWALHLANRSSDAKEQAEHCILHFPRHESTNFYASQILAFNDEPVRAIALAHEFVERSPWFDIPSAVEAYAHARAGNRAAALSILDRLEQLGRKRFVLSSFLAPIFVALGDSEKAVIALKDAEEAGCPWFFQLLTDPRLSDLHGHPEFERMHACLRSIEELAAVS